MPHISRRASFAALGLLALTPRQVSAQPAWPSRPIRIVVAWPAGGSTDSVMRLLAAPMQAALGQPVVIENRAGASGSIGAAAVAQAAADGYTVLGDASSQAVNPALMRGLPFDYATAFAPVTQLCIAPALLLVRAEDGPADLPALLARLRAGATAGGAGGDRTAYSSSGIGAAAHLATAAMLRQAGVTATHVPYRGSPQQVQAVLTGEVLFTFSTAPAAAGLIRDGKLRPLAVSSARRLSAFPEVPTVAEQGFPGFAVTEWLALFVPAGVPAPMVAKLAEAARTGLADPALRDRMALLGMEVLAEGPVALGAFLAEQRVKLAAVIEAEGIRLD